MHVLNLTTDVDSPPFQCQVRALEEQGITCSTVSVPGSSGVDSTRSIRHYLRTYPEVLKRSLGSYDLIHANYGLTAPIALTQPRLPVVLSLWGSDMEGQVGWLSERCTRFCDATVVMSADMKRRLGPGCHVVPHGVDLDLFQPVPQLEAIRAVDWDPDVHNVLFPYRPDRTVKNYPRAERVVEAVDDRLPTPVELRSVNGVAHDEMPTYMNAADCLLLTSHREGSPNVVKEALACNLPVLSTDVGDVRERLEGVEPSAVCQSDDEFVEALASTLRRGGRSNGREFADEFSSRRMAERLRAVYREATAER